MKTGFKLLLSFALATGFLLTGCSTIKNAFGGHEKQASESKQHAHAKKKAVKHAKKRHAAPAKQAVSPTPANAPAASAGKAGQYAPGKLNVTVLYDKHVAAGALVSVSSKNSSTSMVYCSGGTSAAGECTLVLSEGDYDLSVSFKHHRKSQPVHVAKGQQTEVTVRMP